MKSPERPSIRALLEDATTCVLAVVGPFLALLHFEGYRLSESEVILGCFLLMLPATLVWLLLRRGGAWRVVGLFLVLFVFVDCQLNLQEHLSFWFVPVPLALIVWIFRTHLSSAMAVSLTLFYVSVVALPPGGFSVRPHESHATVPVDTVLPPIFHVVLDELADVPESRAAAGAPGPGIEAVEQVLGRYGFLVFRNVYSRYTHTEMSLSAAMNDSTGTDPMANLSGRLWPDSSFGWPFMLRRSLYLRTLGDQGYVADVYQSAFLDYCGTREIPIERCFTYPFEHSATLLSAMTLSVPAKALVLVAYYLNRASNTFVRAREAYLSTLGNRRTPRGLHWLRWSGTTNMSFGGLLERVEADARSGVRGRVFLVHALDPHYPYTRDTTCRTVPDVGEWLDSYDPLAAPERNTVLGRLHRYGRYRLQLGCLARELDLFLTWLSGLPQAGDAVVVLHGDHGSRLAVRRARAEDKAALSAQDIADRFSTLFALKGPRVSSGVVDQVSYLGDLLIAALRSGFASVHVGSIDTMSVLLRGAMPELEPLLLERQAAGSGPHHLVPARASRH